MVFPIGCAIFLNRHQRRSIRNRQYRWTRSSSRHSRRIHPMRRSAWPVCQGDRAAVGQSRIPIARMRRVYIGPNAPSRSRIRYRGAVSQGKASVCHLSGDPFGGRTAVTPNAISHRR